jgi:nicotinamide mononucleotide transporter
VVFWRANLVMESALQVYYLGMAVYGWWHWRGGARARDEEPLRIGTWSARQHAVAIAAVIGLALLSGEVLSRTTTAALPFVDSFTTFGAVLTTWMVARKLLENWLYWIVIDGVSIGLYLQRELYLTAGLFAVYVVIVVFGYRRWLAHYRAQEAAPG